MDALRPLFAAIEALSDDELAALKAHIERVQQARQPMQPQSATSNVQIGLIADMHGDLVGFQQALALFDQAGVSQILCAGDIADRGAEADTIVKIIQERGIVCITGNHDHTVVQNQPKWRATDNPERLKELGRIISDETVAFLKTLPASNRLTIAGKRILMGHGTPWSDVLAVFPDTRQGIFDQIYERYAADTDMIILGHTHMPMQAVIGNLWIYNPGSIYGVTIRDSHTCGILSLPDGAFTVYDVHTNMPVELPITQR
jgi:putative phosphoesterase